MISPISNFLPEFSAHVLGFEPSFDPPPETDGFDAEIEPAFDDTAQRLAEARAEGIAEGSSALEAALADQAADLAARHAVELIEARGSWIEQQGTILAAALARALVEIETRLAEGVADVLGPVFEAAVRQKAADELRQTVASLIATGPGMTIRMTGPADLVEPLRAAFEGRAMIETETNDAPDVQIEADGTLIRTQLEAWADALRPEIKESL